MSRRPTGTGNRVAPSPTQTQTGITDNSPLAGRRFNPGETLIHGTIVAVDANRHTYQVITPSGMVTTSRIRSNPGDTALLTTGTHVLVISVNGRYFINGIFPDEVETPTEETPNRVSGTPGHGGEDPVFSRNLGASARNSGVPTDLMPGDNVVSAPDGATMGVLHGKTAFLKASPLSWLRLFGDSDKAELIAGIFRFVSWLGECNIVNENGKVSLIWRSGVDQTTQTGVDAQRYPIRFDLGHTGNILKLEICNTDGQALFRFHVDPQGKLDVFAAGGIEQSSGSTSSGIQRFANDQQTVVNGNQTEQIDGTATLTYNESLTTEITGNERRTVGTDSTLFCGGKFNVNAISDVNIVTQKTQISSATSIKMETITGATEVKSPSILLGLSPVSSGTKYEELIQQLNLWLRDYSNFKQAMCTHTHPLVLPPAPPMAGPNPSLAAHISPPTINFQLAKCAQVKLG